MAEEQQKKEQGNDAQISRRNALKLGVAAVAGLAVGVVGTEIIQGQKISNLNSTISSLNTSLSSLSSNMSSTAAELAGQPFYLDTVNNRILMQATVNASGFTSPTIPSIVWNRGSNAGIAMFTPTATPEQLYNGLITLGATPGNAVQLTSPKGTIETGTPIDVYVTWEGAPQKYRLEDLINDYSPGGDFVFGGDLATEESAGTGCEVCLFSCAVAIVSSSAVGWEESAGYTLNSSLAPPAGTVVTISFEPQL